MEVVMSRVAAAIVCTAEDMKELEQLSKSRTDEARMVERAQLVLGCLSGQRNDEGVIADVPGDRQIHVVEGGVSTLKGIKERTRRA
jgi:hypothetical protein